MENAHRLLGSKDREAFDISLEPKESFDKYNPKSFRELAAGFTEYKS